MASPLKGAIEVKGHDTRTRRPKQVAARLGERFHPWQLEGTVEESWEECRRHAENLRLIRSISTPVAPVQQSQSQAPTVTGEPPVLRDLLEDRIETDLFGSKMPRLSRRPRRM
jgi:hypothetical protein